MVVVVSAMTSLQVMHVDCTCNVLYPPTATFGKGTRMIILYSCLDLPIPSINCNFFLRKCTSCS